MTDTTPRRLRHCLVVAAATLSLACASARPSVPQQVAPSPAPRNDHRSVAQDECANLQPPATTKLAVHAYATGVQIYRWSGTSWSFVGPEAILFADAAGRSRIGTHYTGPTWASDSGGKVVGTVAQRCTPDSTAVPWLSLGAVPGEEPGIFRNVAFIQRMRTVGGVAPSTPGSSPGEEARVPYTAEYFFYRRD